MRKALLFLPALLLLAACSAAADDVESADSQVKATDKDDKDKDRCPEVHGAPHFSYGKDEHGGPDTWDEIDGPDGKDAYPACGEPGQQSPIDLPEADAATRSPFALGKDLAWGTTTRIKSVINNGHTWLVTPDGSSNVLTDAATTYKLAQFHFHAPSEHTLDGKRYPLEAHFVHLGPTGTQPFAAVVAVFFEEDGADNPELAKVWKKLDGLCPATEATEVKDVSMDLPKLLPRDRTYYRYDGSLTAPPCTKTVRFHVLPQPIKASAAQIGLFKKALGPTNRPVQPVVQSTRITLHEPK